MPVTFVEQTLAVISGNSATCTLSPSVAGDFLLAHVYTYSDPTATPPNDDWELLTTQSFTGDVFEIYIHVYYKIAGTGETSHTFSCDNSVINMRLSSWRGCSQVETFNVASEDYPSDNDLSWPSLTSTLPDSMLVCVASVGSNVDWNTQAGWTVLTFEELLAYKALPTPGVTGVQTHSHTSSSAGHAGVMLILATVVAGFRHYCESVNLDLA